MSAGPAGPADRGGPAGEGRFVTLEGGEGSGKSTLMIALAARAREAGRTVVTTREPGGTPLGERLREALLGSQQAPSPQAELLVFAAARAELVARVIRPALEQGALVLSDRYADSTVAYQQYGRGLAPELVSAAIESATGGLTPVLTLLLDIAPELGIARSGAAGDYLERDGLEFHARVRDGYRALAERDPGRWATLDATLPPDALAALAWERLSAVLLTSPSAKLQN